MSAATRAPGLAPMTSGAFSSPFALTPASSSPSLPAVRLSPSPSLAIHRGNCGCAVTSLPPSKEQNAYSPLFLSIFVRFVSLLCSELRFRFGSTDHSPLFAVCVLALCEMRCSPVLLSVWQKPKKNVILNKALFHMVIIADVSIIDRSFDIIINILLLNTFITLCFLIVL